ncbi:MAG: hypothetical protein IJ615_00410 [Bacteroidaceae bacterium]|nr:hypothetical protein [Bacteroidaceae bacterium]
MNSYKLYRLIRHNANLQDQRHPMIDKNRFMKFLMAFMWLYDAAILLFMGVVMGIGMKNSYNGVAAFHVFDGGMLYLIIVDFWLRFGLQETPAQRAQPYALLPVRRSFLMHTYLIRSGLAWGNLYWWFLLVPFGLITITVPLGWGAFFGWLLGWWLLCIANGFFYLFCRALILKHLAWTLLPAAIHGALLAIMLVPDKNPLDMPSTLLMYSFLKWDFLPFLCTGILIALLYWANFRLQMGMVHAEIGKKEDREMKHATQLNFLNRYGKLGEYLKLEVKQRLRNKSVRMSFFVGIGFMVMFSVIMYFSDVYDNNFMRPFICLYNYIILGMMTLVTIMCYEGNYIDGLMSRRESILQLLTAKYYFNVLLLFIPPIIQLPLMIIGKMSVWMNAGYFFLTAGVLYPMFFQMAVYNNNTLPMNSKITSKQGNTAQQIISTVIFFLPLGLERAATALLGEPWGYILLAAFGIAGIATHPYWLRNVYRRFMARRYKNMEGFRASRQS